MQNAIINVTGFAKTRHIANKFNLCNWRLKGIWLNFGETQIFAWLDREIIPLRSKL